MESLALGTPTISIDIDGYYTWFLKNILAGNPYNYLLRSKEGLSETLCLLQGRQTDPEEFRRSIDAVFSKMVSLKAFHNFF